MDERFRELFEQYHRQVLAYALRRCAAPADAQDVAAETFAVAWRRLPDVPSGAAALPWLYAVARYCLANVERGRRRVESLRARLASQPAVPADDVGAAVRAALAGLAPDDQEVLRLAAWEGLSHAEIGVVLGVSAGAVASRLHRARRRLRAVLESREGVPGA